MQAMTLSCYTSRRFPVLPAMSSTVSVRPYIHQMGCSHSMDEFIGVLLPGKGASAAMWRGAALCLALGA